MEACCDSFNSLNPFWLFKTQNHPLWINPRNSLINSTSDTPKTDPTPTPPKVALKAWFLHYLFRHFRKLVKQIRLAHDVQVACAIHGQAFGLGGAVLEVGEGSQQ